MRRRGFLINSAAIVLIIPLLLLLAVYSSAQFQITSSQSERLELQRLNWAVSYIQEDMKNALRISGKRALVSMINYVVTTGTFVSKANLTMEKLMLNGTAPGITNLSIMANQTLRYWLNGVASKLLKDGLVLSTSDVGFHLQIAPLDSFQIAIKARLTNVTISDLNGRVVYRGDLPTKGYVYSVINIVGLEDPTYAVATNGHYHRTISVCNFPYPEIGAKPVKWVLGVGNSTVLHVVGDYFSDIHLNSTAIWTVSPQSELFNLSANPLNLFRSGDRGVLVYGNVTLPTLRGNWGNVSTSYNYRVNFTLTNFKPNSLTLLVINMNDWTYGGKSLNQLIAHTTDSASMLIYDSNGNQIPFWVEYWNNNGELWLWMKTTNVNSYSLYFSDDPSLETRGYDTGDLFYFLDDFLYNDTSLWHYNDSVQYSAGKSWLLFNSTGETRAAISNATFNISASSPFFFVRWGMNASSLNAGAGIYRPPTAGQNYLDVVVRYGGVHSRSVYWPYNTSGTSSVSSLNDVIYYNFTWGYWNYPWGVYDGDTRWIYSISDAQTAKEWLDEQLSKINGTTVDYENYQIPIYLNATQVQGIEHSGDKAAIEIVDSSGKPVPFWIEYWNNDGALIWVKVNLTERYYTELQNRTRNGRTRYIYNATISGGTLKYNYAKEKHIGHTYYYITLNAYTGAHLKILCNASKLTRGNGNAVFEFFDDFNESLNQLKQKWIIDPYNQGVTVSVNPSNNGTVTISGGNSIFAMRNRNPLNITSDFVVEFRMKPNFTYPGDWDAGVGLWDGKWSPYYGGYLLQQLFTDDIESNNYGYNPLSIHWAEWTTETPNSINNLKSFWAETDDDSAITTNRDYGFHTYEVTELLSQDETYFTDLTRGETNTYDYTPTTLDLLKYIYLVIDSETKSRGAVYDWIFVRRYLDLNYLSETISGSCKPRKAEEYETTGSSWTPYLILWKNWNTLTSGGYSPSGFNRYDLNVSATELNFTRVTGTSTISYTGSFTGSWNVSIVANGNGEAKFDWIIVGPPYLTSGVTFSGVLQSPTVVQPYSYSSAAFDIQPFLDCLENDAYFGVYAGPSLFERLEGKLNPNDTGINGEYWKAATAMQKALGLASNGHYYPIGLVSFIYKPADENLYQSLTLLGLNPSSAAANNISSADYYWLSYYFSPTFTDPATPLRGYRVWGISWGTGSYSYLSSIPFFLDNGSAYVIFGRDVWKYLSYR